MAAKEQHTTFSDRLQSPFLQIWSALSHVGGGGNGPQETCGPKFSGYAVNAEPRPVTIPIVQEPHNPPACAAYGSAFRDRVMGFAAEMHHASAVKRDHDGGDKDQLYHNARDSGQQRAREEHLPGERFA